jgi:hypothetical protein
MAQSVHRLGSDRSGSRAAWPATAPDRRVVETARPFGLSALAMLAFATAIVLLAWARAWIGAPDIVPGTRLASLANVVAVALLVVAGFEIVLAFGVWTMRRWAWRLGVAVGSAAVVLTLLGAGRGTQGEHLLTLILEVVALWYLLTPEVHDLFDSKRRPTKF